MYNLLSSYQFITLAFTYIKKYNHKIYIKHLFSDINIKILKYVMYKDKNNKKA